MNTAFRTSTFFKKVHAYIIGWSMRIPDLPDQPADPVLFADTIRFDLLLGQVFLFIVPDAYDAGSPGTGALVELTESQKDVVIRQQVRHGVVTGYDYVELLGMVLEALTHVSHRKIDF